MAANADPRSFQAALQQILMQGVADGEASDAETMMKANELFAKQQLDQQRSALEMQKLQTQAEAKRAKVVMGVAKQGQQAKMAHEQAVQKEKEKAAAKQQSPQELVNNTLAGTETRTFRPQAPMSANKPDTAGGDVNAVLQAALGGRMAQTAGPMARPQGPTGGPAAQQQQQLPQPGGPNPLQARVGGQTLTAPEQLISRVSSLGAQPVRTQGGFSMAPTFQQRTIREPNVLTAGQVASLNQQQQAQSLEIGLKIWQDSEGAPIGEVLSGAKRYFQEGDPSELLAMSKKYPSLGQAAARADIDYRRQLTETSRAQSRMYQSQADLTDAQRALFELQNNGAADAADWGQWLLGEKVAPQLGLTASGRVSTAGGKGTSAWAKIDPKEVYNEKEGTWDEIAFNQYQKQVVRDEGRIVYKNEGGGPFGIGKEKGAIQSVPIPELVTNILAATGSSDPARREAAVSYLDALPFMDVRSPTRPGDQPIISWAQDNSGAAELAQRVILRLALHRQSGVEIPVWVVDPVAAAHLGTIKAAEAAPAPAPKAAAPKEPFVGLSEGAPIPVGTGRQRVVEGIESVTGAIQDYRQNARPGEGMAVYFARKRRESAKGK